jgi:hypothetical protein
MLYTFLCVGWLFATEILGREVSMHRSNSDNGSEAKS